MQTAVDGGPDELLLAIAAVAEGKLIVVAVFKCRV